MTLYFAYGSNLDWDQMRRRCPSAKFVCVALLKDHSLTFPRCSRQRNCGVASVAPKQGREVWGVVYEILEGDMGRLNCSEGFVPGRGSNAYVPRTRHVFRDGDKDDTIAVTVYVAVPEEQAPLPSAKYRDQIVDGARFWHLPEAYVCGLKEIEVAE